MISNRPYMIRALYEWIVDNQWTPHVQVDARFPGVDVPQAFVQDGTIVLNMHPQSVMGLTMENDWFSFRARFKGVEQTIGFPPQAVEAVFARENGQGMSFPPEPYPELPSTSQSGLESDSKPVKGKKPTLTIVK